MKAALATSTSHRPRALRLRHSSAQGHRPDRPVTGASIPAARPGVQRVPGAPHHPTSSVQDLGSGGVMGTASASWPWVAYLLPPREHVRTEAGSTQGCRAIKPANPVLILPRNQGSPTLLDHKPVLAKAPGVYFAPACSPVGRLLCCPLPGSERT